jgi:hypothetical protein
MGGPESGPRPGPDSNESIPEPAEQADRLLEEFSALHEQQQQHPKSRLLKQRLEETKRRLAQLSSQLPHRPEHDPALNQQLDAALDDAGRIKEQPDPQGSEQDIDRFMERLSTEMTETEDRIHEVREEFMGLLIALEEVEDLSAENTAGEEYRKRAHSLGTQTIVSALKMLGKDIEEFSLDQYSSIIEPVLDTYHGPIDALDNAKRILLDAQGELSSLKAELGG